MENKSSSNTVQAFWVLLGSLSAFGFTIVSSMLLSRYFNKNDYGTYKQVMYVYSSLLVVFTLGLPKAFSYFLPRVTKGQAKDLISKLNLILMGMGLIMSACFFFGADLFASVLKNNELVVPIKYFSLVPLFLLPTMGVEGILATYKKTQLLAVYKTCSQFFMLAAVVLPVILFKGTINTAIIGFTISSFLCFLVALFLKNNPIKNYGKEKSVVTYKEIFKYTIPIMGASIWGIIITSSDQFFISRYFGSEVFADFANGSLELPFVGMIIASTSTVLAPIFSKHVFEKGKDSKAEVLLLWQSVLSKTVKIIYPLVVFCFCFASSIMVILYGEKYADSGTYFQIKLIVNFFTVIAYGPLLLSIGGEKFYFNVHMYGAFILVGLEWLVVTLFDSPYLVTATSVFCQIGRIVIMMSFIASYFNVKLIDLFPIKLSLKIIIPSFVLIFGIKFLLLLFFNVENLFVLIFLTGLFYLITYYVYVRIIKIDYMEIINPLLNKIKFNRF
ncbi:oligosaccharide flippase family protein [Amniculibacterium aquaticum]|uniref:oligosaccharide flippase family protein n=1 Tax=Amniculibacterium aquaticum TaxID=2479858 RepID=UPI000F5A60DA|nr:oligosaccharide flippase family protein [Amniculibacterium aquaticum]